MPAYEEAAPQPAVPAVSPAYQEAPPQPAVPAVPPLLPAAPTSQPAPAPQPYTPSAPTPQPYAQPTPTPYAQPAPTPQPYARPEPAPQPYAQPAPAPQPYAPAAPAPQPYPQPAPRPYAQPAPQPAGAQPVVSWTLQVIRDGQLVDSLQGATAVGQAQTISDHKVVTHNVGCLNHPAGSIDLQRTITITPLRADPASSVLAIQAQETVESDSRPLTPEGCRLPPQLSQVHANHPGLVVPANQWVTWQIVNQDPSLLYRVRATLAQP